MVFGVAVGAVARVVLAGMTATSVVSVDQRRAA
jgi:hypothetical protein